MAAEVQSAFPTFDELLWPTIKALKAMGGSGSNEELLSKVIELEGIPENIQSFIHTDNRQTKLEYNLAWAKTYLKRVGAVENSSRGVWALTALGESMTAKDCEDVPRKVRRQDYERKKAIEDQAPGPGITAELPPEETWKDVLLHALGQMKPDAFERLAQRLL